MEQTRRGEGSGEWSRRGEERGVESGADEERRGECGGEQTRRYSIVLRTSLNYLILNLTDGLQCGSYASTIIVSTDDDVLHLEQ